MYAEHSFKPTFTAEPCSDLDIHGAITGAIASLKGPLQVVQKEVMHMMNKIKPKP